MENKKQTQVTDQNRKDFQAALHQHAGTFDISTLAEQTIIAVDCQGHKYQLLHPSKSVLALETMSNVLDFRIPKDQFYKFVDDRQYNKLGWPKVDVKDCAVLFDCSPILKYRTVEEISLILDEVSNRYLPTTIVVNLNLMHVDDNRLADRFYNMAKLRLSLYVVQEFSYNANAKSLLVKLHRKVTV
jgi:hypothetical protein